MRFNNKNKSGLRARVHVTAVSNKTVKQTNHRAATLQNILGLAKDAKDVSCHVTRFKFDS